MKNHELDVKNISMSNRAVRVLLGCSMVGIVFFSNSVPLGWLAMLPLIAIYPLMTGVLGWDPVYAAFRRLHSQASETSGQTEKVGTVAPYSWRPRPRHATNTPHKHAA